MKGIFISYRRADSAPYAGRICDHLRRTFPSLSVFMDVEAITPGSDFIHAMDANLADSAVVLAVIGPQWESIRASHGQLEAANDYVVRELAAALQGQAVVIPLLVGGAKMPSAATLPPSLHELSRRNALEISDGRFAEDAERLCKAISDALGLPADDEHYRQRVEYGRFFSNAELTRAHTQFRRLVWISFALVVLYVTLSQLWMGGARVNSSTESMPTLNCDDPALKTAEERAACVAMNRTMQGTASFAVTLDRVVLPLVLLFFGGFLLLVHVKVLRGKRWARVAFAAVGAFVALSVFDVLFSNPLRGAAYVSQVVLYAATLTAYAWGIRLMFTEPVRRWFVRV
jgi:hypothetical protein